MTRTDATRLFGTQQPPVQGRVLRAGPLEARLENGNLRYIRYDGHEVLRAISYVVRDRNWGTLTPKISRLGIEETRSGFHVTYLAGYSNDGADLTVETRIQGASSGRLTFTARAVAGQDFETNRCGFTVLHPINGLAGAPVTVEHCDGSVEETVFPELIEPWQPFKSIRALTHAPAAHLKACCRMEGDDFEMEDQRNWSDASFKTYVRPLELPWPYVVPASSELTQAVDLQIEVTGSARAAGRIGRSDALSPVDITVNGPTGATFPRIGLLVNPEDVAQALGSVGLLSDIGPQAILCHFDPTASHGVEDLRAFRELQQAFPAAFDLEYVVACEGDLDAEFARLAEMIAESGLEPASLAVCPSVDRQSTPPGSSWPDCPPLEKHLSSSQEGVSADGAGWGACSAISPSSTASGRQPGSWIS
ncbi:hypothetical protein QW131_29835 [Roseibium salinum]|nr:hypothetical protein [Roseibium salinum]